MRDGKKIKDGCAESMKTKVKFHCEDGTAELDITAMIEVLDADARTSTIYNRDKTKEPVKSAAPNQDLNKDEEGTAEKVVTPTTSGKEKDEPGKCTDQEKSLPPLQPRSRIPCKRCRMTRCSNCLVPFKPGDKMVSKIPSIEVSTTSGDKSVPLEIALICVFDPSNPYPQWIKDMETAESIPSRLFEMVDGGFDWESKSDDEDEDLGGGDTSKDLKDEGNKKDSGYTESTEEKADQRKRKVERILSHLLLEVENEMKNSDVDSIGTYLNLIKTKIIAMKKSDRNKDTPTQEEVKTFILEKLEEFKLEKEKEKQETKVSITAKKITEEMSVNAELKRVPDFKFCVGCAEVLSTLFTAWEFLQAKKLTERSYFHAVMVGFKNAAAAQDVIFRAPKSSKMYVYSKYGRECHPVGCQQRTTRNGTRVCVGGSKEDLIRHAVGNLHSVLEESYRRVHNEMIKLAEESDEDSSDSEGDDEEGEEGEERDPKCLTIPKLPKKEEGIEVTFRNDDEETTVFLDFKC